MAFILGKLKCYFCGKSEGLLHSVHDYDHYGDAGRRLFYHDECLQMVEIEPEKFGHNMVDKAIHINDLKESCMKKFNNKIIEEFRKKVEKLNTKNFERMMPK